MQKPFSIILIFIFSVCLSTTGAFGYADCGSRCCCKSGMTGPEQAAHTPDNAKDISLQLTSNCCSGSTATACDFTGGTAESLPETGPVTVRSELPDFSNTGLAATYLLIENSQPKIYARESDPWLKTRPRPIYLQIHTFLC